MATSYYSLKKYGPTMSKIFYAREELGWISKTADGYRARIRKIEVLAPTEEDAFDQVLEAYTGQPISDIPRNTDTKKVQVQTEIILDFLKDNAAANEGRLSFTNTDIAVRLGRTRPDQALGNLISRLDFACYAAGLPALGLTAEERFKNSWNGQDIADWRYPVEIMTRRAKSHRWSIDDFNRIRLETRRITGGMAHLIWKEELARHEARIKEWCLLTA